MAAAALRSPLVGPRCSAVGVPGAEHRRDQLPSASSRNCHSVLVPSASRPSGPLFGLGRGYTGLGDGSKDMKGRVLRGHRRSLQMSAGGTVDVPIIVGTVAGVTPFVVAGIEFSKRIVQQRQCEVCKGSGLVLRGRYYRRCNACGGFLPWQSWKRFFDING